MPRGSFAIVTGASTGIGYELAKCCARDGFDLLIAADEERIQQAADNDQLVAAAEHRPVDALLANAGRGLGKGFLDRSGFCRSAPRRRHQHHWYHLPFAKDRSTDARSGAGAHPDHRIDRRLYARHLSGSYNRTKAFLDSFSFASRHELKGSGVSVTCLMPGATETDFFERADMLDTKVGTQKRTILPTSLKRALTL
jgi:NAD(P)-dependent dehydrogenase (short-subunit alcohol dehydrogenase family)